MVEMALFTNAPARDNSGLVGAVSLLFPIWTTSWDHSRCGGLESSVLIVRMPPGHSTKTRALNPKRSSTLRTKDSSTSPPKIWNRGKSSRIRE